jgi:phage terminase small subunit
MARLKDQNLVSGAPKKSLGLSERASAEWDRLLAEFAEAGIQVTVAHRALLTLAATTAADIRREWEAIVQNGEYQMVVGKGMVQHPAVKRMDALRKDYIKILSMLGLRSGVVGGKTDETLEDVLNG